MSWLKPGAASALVKMPTTTITDKKSAEATTPGGFELVFDDTSNPEGSNRCFLPNPPRGV